MADVDLHLQDPGDVSGHLLETLLTLAATAERGGAIFAFATADGIRALFEEVGFKALMRKGEFRLVVGVDAVTNENAIRELKAASQHHRRLLTEVLVHDESVLFHPKLSWFRRRNRLTVVVGSGNLTMRGLRENWEAFTTYEVRGADADTVERDLEDWINRHGHLLHPPDDAEVLRRARRNTGRERDLKHPRRQRRRETVPTRAEVFVAEAPKSGSRPSQVNFHKDHYEGFFGAKAGTDRRVVLRSVSATGELGEEEVRPSSSRRSRNFSLELAAFHAPPPRNKRPIGVYVRLPQGTFLYQRVAPGDTGYDELDDFLTRRWTGPANQMRQVPASLAEVKRVWPSSSLWAVDVPSS